MGYKTYTCPIARFCGGCEWLAVPYPIQLRRKQEQVEELFAKTLSADDATLQDIRGMDEPVAYRHKAATPFSPGKGHKIRSGFYAAGSHRIVACNECLVEAPGARQLLNDVARIAADLRIPAYDEDRATGILRHAVVRVGWATDDVMLTLVTNGDRLPRREQLVKALLAEHPELTTIVQNVNDRRTNAILGRLCHTLHGPGTMEDKLLGCTFSIGPTSFYQTNPAQTEVLYQLAIDGARLTGGERVLDAYCGCGTIGICVAAQARRAGTPAHVLGIEQVAPAIKLARTNAQANDVAGDCDFVRDDATAHLADLRRERGAHTFDVVIMDPPRAGSTPEFLASVAAIAPARVVYVSCNPKTQVRDIDELREKGYRLASLAPVDMFPHTKHVETVAVLERR